MDDIRDKVLGSTEITPFQRRVYLALLDVPPDNTSHDNSRDYDSSYDYDDYEDDF